MGEVSRTQITAVALRTEFPDLLALSAGSADVDAAPDSSSMAGVTGRDRPSVF